FAEVSGKQHLDFTGLVDLRAPMGKTGTLLLDPADYYIVSDKDRPPPQGASVITNTQLQSQLALANVVIATDNNANPVNPNGEPQKGDIFVNASVNWTGANSLTLSAFHNITFNNGSIISNVGSGNLTLRADNTGTGSGTVTFTPFTTASKI